MFAIQMGADSGCDSSISVLPSHPFTVSCQILESTIENRVYLQLLKTQT